MSKRLIAKFLSTQKMGACSVSTLMASYTDVSHSISVLEPVDGTGDVVTGHALLARGHGVMAVHG